MMVLGPLFNGLRLIITRHAKVELYSLGLTGWDAEEVLSNGWNCSRSKRSKGKIERCSIRGKKIIRVVAVKGIYDLEESIEDVYYLIHVSVESRNKIRMRREGD
jgi:hypothetical protein